MNLKSFFGASVIVTAAAAGATASAQDCAGFSDVSSSSAFCPNVAWLRNRAITLGCTSTAHFCPGESVTRLSMAAFMNRLGTALTPIDLDPVIAAPAVLDPTLDPLICPTAAPGFAVSGFPRRAFVNGAVHLSSPTVAVDIVSRVVMSTDNGATWTQIAHSDHYATLYPGSTPAQHVSVAPFSWVDLDVGETVRFGITLGRFAGTGTAITAACTLAVQIGNRNPGATLDF